MSVFTVDDVTFGRLTPQDIGDPFVTDPWLQRLVLNTQLVDQKVDPDNLPMEVKTVGGRVLDLTKATESGNFIFLTHPATNNKEISGLNSLASLRKKRVQPHQCTSRAHKRLAGNHISH